MGYTIVSWEYLLVLLLGIVVFFAAVLYMKWKMEPVSVWRKELCYEIYYRGKQKGKNTFVLSERRNQKVRFGYSSGSKYHNDIALENLMNPDDIEAEDLAEISKKYKTWFVFCVEEGEIFVKPSYTMQEDLKGLKKIYMKDGHILDDAGEKFTGKAAFYSSDSENAAFEIIVYDDHAVND